MLPILLITMVRIANSSTPISSLPLLPDRTKSMTDRSLHKRERFEVRRPLTNTNTDTLCCGANEFFWKKWLYRFNLWTGLYMLNPYERTVFHIVGWFSLTVSLLYIYVFWKGFVDGFSTIR